MKYGEFIKHFLMFLIPVGLPIYAILVDRSDWFFDRDTVIAFLPLQFSLIAFSMLIDNYMEMKKSKSYMNGISK
jgi:hypothetical protein